MKEIVWNPNMFGSKSVEGDLKRMAWDDERKLASLTLGRVHGHPSVQAVWINNSLVLEGPVEERQAVLREARKLLEEVGSV